MFFVVPVIALELAVALVLALVLDNSFVFGSYRFDKLAMCRLLNIPTPGKD